MSSDATRSYGYWESVVDGGGASVEHYVAETMSDFADDYDIDKIVDEFRAAINAALPDGVSLAGNEFLGPVDIEWVDINQVIDDIDFWAIMKRNEKKQGGSK
jgi:hypothetical protein